MKNVRQRLTNSGCPADMDIYRIHLSIVMPCSSCSSLPLSFLIQAVLRATPQLPITSFLLMIQQPTFFCRCSKFVHQVFSVRRAGPRHLGPTSALDFFSKEGMFCDLLLGFWCEPADGPEARKLCPVWWG